MDQGRLTEKQKKNTKGKKRRGGIKKGDEWKKRGMGRRRKKCRISKK